MRAHEMFEHIVANTVLDDGVNYTKMFDRVKAFMKFINCVNRCFDDRVSLLLGQVFYQFFLCFR